MSITPIVPADHGPTAPLPIGVRAFALPPELRVAKAVRPPKPTTDEPIRYVLFLDTETSRDTTQRLRFGVYRLAEERGHRASGTARLVVLEEGLIYADELETTDAAGFVEIQEYARWHAAEVVRGESRQLLAMTRSDFVNRVLYPFGYQAKALIVGFNLPFDLSRLAVDASPARNYRRAWRMAGGWSLTLWAHPDGRPFKGYPRIAIKHIDRNRSLLAFTSAEFPEKRRRRTKGQHAYRGRFLDLKTLVFALTNQGMSLASACETFKTPYTKGELPDTEEITPVFINYCRGDVRATQALYDAVMEEYRRHPIGVAPWAIRSPASLAKAYLRVMGITPPLHRCATIPRALLGAATSCYFGGQAEVRIRKHVVPVVATDVTSMYPTVNVLGHFQDFLTAEALHTEDCTDEARMVLDRVAVDRLLAPEAWPELRFFAQVQFEPGALDTVPVRAKFGGQEAGYTMSVNPVVGPARLWYTGFDLARSILLTQHIPRIRKAFRLVPKGVLPSLRAVDFRGEIPIDPQRQDIFRSMIEARHRVKNDESMVPAQRDALQRGIKVFAASGSYGILAEVQPEDRRRDDPATVSVHAGGKTFLSDTLHPERPGEFCFPPIAALITSAARLLLGVVERLVIGRGGTYLAMDTDSIHIVATEIGGLIPCPGGPARMPDGREAVVTLPWVQVEEIVKQVEPLKPYGPDVRDTLLKIEAENFDPQTRKQVQLYGLALATKRYCLFVRGARGAIILRRRSDHGLGQLLDPTDPDVRAERTEIKDPNQGWEAEIWRRFVGRALGRRERRFPAWYGRVAVARFSASSPRLLAPVSKSLRERPYPDRLKPFNFLLTCYIQPSGHPGHLDPARARLVAAYQRDPRRWLEAEWGDLHSGESCRIRLDGVPSATTAVVKTLGEIIEQFWLHPESKSLAPDGSLCGPETRGLLRRRPVRPSRIDAIGKEANKLEEVELQILPDLDEVQAVYHPRGQGVWREQVLAALAGLPLRYIMKRAGVSERTLFRLRAGQPVGRGTKVALSRLAQAVRETQRHGPIGAQSPRSRNRQRSRQISGR